ncbi:MAG: ATP-binding cassette domain-containing protein [Candidatus Gracilibacteria bacterium]|jgi:ATP-binding cassette subfamily F protein 3
MANTIISFDEVHFGFDDKKPLLDGVSFNVREGAKITLMGQNGAGKSSILKLITGQYAPKRGQVNIFPGYTIGTAHQVMSAKDRELTVEQFFQNCFTEKKYDISRHIKEVLEVVNLNAPLSRQIKSFSGGQQARLLLAAALIKDPDLLLLDEPTNNLDPEGIAHLTYFLQCSPKTCIVISHDADFLNAFTEGVLYLDVHTKKVEQYVGDYFSTVEQIKTRIEKENMKNARLEKEIQENKEQSSIFAHKGGKLRFVAKRMLEKAEELEASMVDVRREDRTIRSFVIPTQPDMIGEIISIKNFATYKNHEEVPKKADISMHKNQHLLLSGPNGIGKSTLLEAIANGTAAGVKIQRGIKVGYYRQDFSNLDFEDTVLHALSAVTDHHTEQEIRAIAAGFLITGDVINRRISSLSEGQKGLVAFARLVLEEPGLLILDEPTNHMNFRHIPVIAKALHEYEGAMILVSHVWDFVKQVRIDLTLDLEK